MGPSGEMPSARQEHAGAVLTIDLAAIRANYRLLQGRLGKASCAAVVKADAYGLGAARVAPVLAAAGCTHFFVAHLEEALALSSHLPEGTALYVLHGPPVGAEAELLAHRLVPVLNSLPQLDAWTALARARGRPLPALLQLDTGMSRLGLSHEEVKAVIDDPARLEGLELRYVMSHLACAEVADHPLNERQLARFRELCRALPRAPASFANSSAVFLGPDYHFDLARPGAALYGVAPTVGRPNPLAQVVSLAARVIQLRTIPAGTSVGYNARWTAPELRRIATVAAGYADGYLRSLSNRATAWFGDTPLPLVGGVSMDTITLDVTALRDGELQPGSLVELIGAHHSIDALAEQAGTIAYEVLTSLGSRYFRRYVGEEDA
ncbi:MAG TPA: alanine racemase [Alphaproteobacteria bacterium]|nr:alanine racemase [Alphaproteobacteria bacterium]